MFQATITGRTRARVAKVSSREPFRTTRRLSVDTTRRAWSSWQTASDVQPVGLPGVWRLVWGSKVCQCLSQSDENIILAIHFVHSTEVILIMINFTIHNCHQGKAIARVHSVHSRNADWDRHLLLLLSPKADTYFTISQRIEGWVIHGIGRFFVLDTPWNPCCVSDAMTLT